MARQALTERREQLGLTQAMAAQAVGCDVGTYSRYERGLSTPRGAKRQRLADALGWTMAQLTQAIDEITPNGHPVPGWLGGLAGIEQGASRLCAFEPVAVHGLLQTAGYAYAIESVGPGHVSDEDVALKVEARLDRQAVLEREPDPLELAVVIDESVLRRPAGGREAMADQLDHMAAAADRPNVDLRVLPLDSGVFAAAFGSFALLWADGADGPSMAITEDRLGGHYLDRPPELEAHSALFAFLSDAALSPAASVDLIHAAAKEYR
jgi:transcriptional regulator with XRE-family HTH domain